MRRLVVLSLLVALAACGSASSEADDAAPTVVVSFPVLGAVVADAVGDAADVKVLMPNGVDPHDWQPAPKDIEALEDADLVVVNGFDLEAGLLGAVDQAKDDGVPVFEAASAVEAWPADDDDEHSGDDEHSQDEHGHDLDPHLWLDPIAMADVSRALGPALAGAGIDAGDAPERTAIALEALDAQVREELATVPDDRRVLVTGHESMGWFARRYGFEVIGTIIPSRSSQAEVSAADLAALQDTIAVAGVPAIFTEIGTPGQVAKVLAESTGVEVVELASHHLPDDGTYASFLLGNATAIAGALGGG